MRYTVYVRSQLKTQRRIRTGAALTNATLKNLN